MDLDRAFVASLLKGGREAVREAQDKGILSEFLTGDGLKAWDFVCEYLKQYPDCPSPEIVQGKIGVDVGPAPEQTYEFFIDEVRNRRLHQVIGESVRGIIEHLESGKAQQAYEAYETGLRELRQMHLATSKTIALWSKGPQFLEYYDKLKAGHTGIRTPWTRVNEDTLGFWPEDFVLFVARLGVGKTWTLVMLALHAWFAEEKKVLFATTEMSYEKILQRMVAMHFRLPYEDVRKGKLSAFAEPKMRDGIEALKDDERLRIIGGDFDFRIESLEAAIEECEPDILFIDGAYLLRVGGDGRIERAANSFDELKRVAKRNHIPVVASTQFNRDAKVNKAASASVDKIALSDAAGWNADLIYGLIQTEDMKQDQRMIFKPLKFREGSGEEVECWWNFDLMDFREVEGTPTPEAQGEAKNNPALQETQEDPFDTGVLFDKDADDGLPF